MDIIRIIISGESNKLKDEIADVIFAEFKRRGLPAICIDPYVYHPNDFIIGDTSVVGIVVNVNKWRE